MQNLTQRQKIAFLGYLILLNCIVLGAFSYLLLYRPSASPETAIIPTIVITPAIATPFPLPTAKSPVFNSSLGETLPPHSIEETIQPSIDSALASLNPKSQAEELARQIAAPPDIQAQTTYTKPRLSFTPTQTPKPTTTPSSTATSTLTPTRRPTPQPTATATNTPIPTYTFTPQTPPRKAEPTATQPPTRMVTPQDDLALGTKTPIPTLRIETGESKIATPIAVIASSFIDENNSLAVAPAGIAETSSAISQAKAVFLSGNRLSLNWEPFAATQQYGVYSDMGSGFGLYIHKTNTDQPNFIDDNLHLGNSYTYKITRLTENDEVVLAQTRAFTPETNRQPHPQEEVVTRQISPVPTVLPADTIVLGLVSDNRFVDEFGNLTIAGEVRNDSSLSVGQVEILITFYDAAGTIIDTTQGRTLLDVIPPGETSPFLIILPRPANLGAHSLRATARPVAPSLTAQLSAVEVRRFEDDAGFFHIKGTIKNVGNRVAKRIKVAAVIYGRDGRVINVGLASPTSSTLSPGEQASYDIVFTYYPRYISQVVIPFEE